MLAVVSTLAYVASIVIIILLVGNLLFAWWELMRDLYRARHS